MENKNRLIDANKLMKAIRSFRWVGVPNTLKLMFDYLKIIIDQQPTVDAVPVDQIRVDILRISIESQEAILNVSICGNDNEIRIPFEKDVAEVVHGRWIWSEKDQCWVCSNCGLSALNNYRGNSTDSNYCPNCGAKMDGERRTDED